MTTFEDAYERLVGCPAPPVQNPQLQHYWNLPSAVRARRPAADTGDGGTTLHLRLPDVDHLVLLERLQAGKRRHVPSAPTTSSDPRTRNSMVQMLARTAGSSQFVTAW